MAKTYLVAQVRLHNPEGYEAYRSRTREIIERFGGRFLVRGGTLNPLEGQPGFERLVIIEFPDHAAAEAFYHSPQYQELIPHRTANSESMLLFAEGVD
jgi:uncharacterized protein (DUF1330 family)